MENLQNSRKISKIGPIFSSLLVRDRVCKQCPDGSSATKGRDEGSLIRRRHVDTFEGCAMHNGASQKTRDERTMRAFDAATTPMRDETTALLRDPSSTTTKTTRGAAGRVAFRAFVCLTTAAFIGFALWTTSTPEDADQNGPALAAPRFFGTVDVGDGRELSAWEYARFLKERLAEDALSEGGLARGGLARASLGNETDANYDDADTDNDDENNESGEASPEMQALLNRIASDEYELAQLAEAQLGGVKIDAATDTYNAGKSTSGAASSGSFCWKDSYGRGVGTLPKSCPPNKETIAGGLLCYDKCSKFGDFKRSGYDCHQKCKSGWTDHGLLCYKFASSYGRGVGTIPPLTCKKKKWGICYSFESKCPGDRSDKCIGLCYKPCRSGYNNAGCNICSMSCTGQGYANGAAPSCPKRMYLSPGIEGTKCASDQENDAGLCYKKCRDSFTGVGPVCWGQPPKQNGKKWVNCGMGAATDKGTCASTIMDQVTGPAEIAAFVATAGGSTAGTKAAKIKSQMKRDVAEDAGSVKKLVDAIIDVVKAAKGKNGDLAKEAAKNGLMPLIGMLDKSSSLAGSIQTFIDCSGVDCFRGVAELIAIVDPTGIAGTAAAYAYPKCDKVPSSTSSSSQPKTTPTQELKPYVKTAGRALKGNGASGACSAKLYYGSSGIKACEEKCNQCGDCKGFVDNREASKPYCVFKKATNVYAKASKDWYAKPN